MACVTGESHTITLSDDGIVYSFGQNNYGQSGHYKNPSSDEQLGEEQENISLPKPKTKSSQN